MSSRRNCTLNHDTYSFTSAVLNEVARSIDPSERRGFVYAGTRHGLLKVGMTQQCPFCRMIAQRLCPEAVVYSDDCYLHEQRLLSMLGTPVKGREWFTEPEDRLAFLVEHEQIRRCVDIELQILRKREGILA